MGSHIIKLGEYYLMYSTVTDSPTTHGMKLPEFIDYMKGQHGLDELPPAVYSLIQTADSRGISVTDSTLREVLERNQAGRDGGVLTAAQIYDFYCLKGNPPFNLPAEGERLRFHDTSINPDDATLAALLACPCCMTVLPATQFPGWNVAWEAEGVQWDCGGSTEPVRMGHLEVGDWNGRSYEFDADVDLHCCPNCGAMFATNI